MHRCAGSRDPLASVTSESGSAQKSDDGDSRVETRVGWTASEGPASPQQEAAAKAAWVPAAKPVPRKSGESRCPGHGSVGMASVCFIRVGREETTRVTSGDSGGHEAGFYPSKFCPLPYKLVTHGHNWASLVAQRVRSPGSSESTCKAGDPGSIPGSGRPPGEGNGNPVQYSYLENSICMKNVTCHTSKQKMLQPLS